MKLDKTLDETRKKSHCSGLTFGTGERILSLRRTIKIGEKSCVALIVFSLIMAITVQRPIFSALNYEGCSKLGVRENLC